jgi:hypothetical protein
MTGIDYSTVSRDDLELIREPRKSQFTVVHKPTGAVGSTPVVPGSLSPARFRRPTNMPKENRAPHMEGYIEGREEDTQGFYIIVAGETPRNEYLDALAGDADALRATFEGASSQGTAAPTAEAPTAAEGETPPEGTADEQPTEEAATAAEEQNPASSEDATLADSEALTEGATPPSGDEVVGQDEANNLDQILATLNDS